MTRERHNEPLTEPTAPVNPQKEPRNSANLPEKIERDELLRISTALIRTLDRRFRARVFRSSKHDSVRLQYARAIVAALTAHSSIAKDQEAEEIKDRLSRIEAALETREMERKYL